MFKLNKTNESGRSMVEMLGVLAIIGVLSVMGIAGYTSAMKAHKANEIVNAVSKLYLLGMSANEGKGGKELPYADALGTLPTDVSALTFTAENKITATITDEDVCKKVLNMFGTDKVEGSCSGASSALTVTMNPSVSGEQGGSTGSIDTGTCANGNVYLSYAEEGHECDTTTPKVGDSGMDCVKNSDCTGAKCTSPSGKCYCKLTVDLTNLCAEIVGGTCATLDAGTPKNYIHGGTTKKLLEQPGGFDLDMNWWSAENWCKAHHMNLVKASTIGCTTNGTSGSCPNQVYTDLDSSGLGAYYWTSDSYNSCKAWAVQMDKIFEGYDHGDSVSKALCE